MPDRRSPPRRLFGNLPADVCERALEAHDPRFDGLFFVGVTSTRIYCRPVCPSRRAASTNRRFFPSAPAAERAGFRPCLRCRPELAPGRAPVDAMSRLAWDAARRIAAGALNGRSVEELAAELGVSERHLRRALRNEIGVSPLDLALTHRLLLAKRLLADTRLPVIQVAFASGFQSLRRFNAAFREHYRMNPTALRRASGPANEGANGGTSGKGDTITSDGAANGDTSGNGDTIGTGKANGSAHAPVELLRTTLAYRPPFAWDALLGFLAREAIPGVEMIEGGRYGRTVELGGRRGVVLAEDGAAGDDPDARPACHLTIHVSTSLAPVLMPLIARLRQLFDLDAEPSVVDGCLEEGGLGAHVRKRPGLRIPGALDGFEAAFRVLLGRRATRVVRQLGESFDTGTALVALMPTAGWVAEAGVEELARLGVPPRRAAALTEIARAIEDGALVLEPGSDPAATRAALMEIDGIGERTATAIVMRAVSWPDAFPASDPALQRAAGVRGARALRDRAETWRPWRSYAALHLRLDPALRPLHSAPNPRLEDAVRGPR